MQRPWHSYARSEQLPPDGDWSVLLVTAGRGWGKTRSAAEWLVEQAVTHPGTDWAVIAPSCPLVRCVCVEGSAGILRSLMDGELESFNASDLTVRLTNGSRIFGFNGGYPKSVERMRGHRFAGAWVDELSAITHADLVWECLSEAVRDTPHHQIFVTTTPDPVTPLLRRLTKDTSGSVVRVVGSTWENEANLSPVIIAEWRQRYEGARLGPAVLGGEVDPA